MSISSYETTGPLNIYEERLDEDTELDLSGRELDGVPEIVNNSLLSLHLQNNRIVTLPDDFFPTLKCLMWLDLRDNRLTCLPPSIQHHQGLTHLLLQNNCLTYLPNELGTVSNLQVLQLTGNPLEYPPRKILNAGITEILKFLNDKFVENWLRLEDTASVSSQKDESAGSKDQKQNGGPAKMSVKLQDKATEISDTHRYPRARGKCERLDRSRTAIFPPHCQSAKYLMPLRADTKLVQTEKIKQNYLKEVALNKHKDLLAMRDRILQDTKNMELLKNWRQTYRQQQLFVQPGHRLDAASIPYDTNAEFMRILTREDIEKDLPDKYRKSLVRRAKPAAPRKPHDVQLALRIKQLFENLEAIDLNKEGLTPRTEQRMLLNEIHKITEIKQKLMELSSTNRRSVSD